MKTVTFRGGFFKPANASLLFTRKVTFRVEKSDDRKYVCVRRLGFFSRDTLIRDQNSQKQTAIFEFQKLSPPKRGYVQKSVICMRIISISLCTKKKTGFPEYFFFFGREGGVCTQANINGLALSVALKQRLAIRKSTKIPRKFHPKRRFLARDVTKSHNMVLDFA